MINYHIYMTLFLVNACLIEMNVKVFANKLCQETKNISTFLAIYTFHNYYRKMFLKSE
jgi:hypothetical protein